MKRGKPITEESKNEIYNSHYFRTKKGAAELGLLTSIFVNPELIPKIIQNLDVKLVSHPEIKEFFQNIKQEEIEPISFNSNQYLGTIREPFIAKTLSELLSDKNHQQLYNSWQYAYECLISLQLCVVDAEINRLRKDIQNNRNNAKEILEQIKNLEDHKKEIAAGRYLVH